MNDAANDFNHMGIKKLGMVTRISKKNYFTSIS